MITIYKAMPSEVPGVLQLLEVEGLHPVAQDETSFPLPWISSGERFVNIVVPDSESEPAATLILDYQKTHRPIQPVTRPRRTGWFYVAVFIAIGVCALATAGYHLVAGFIALLIPIALLVRLMVILLRAPSAGSSERDGDR